MPRERKEVQASTETRTVDGLGTFTYDSDGMWEGEAEMGGEQIKVFLHAYEVDFDRLADYAKRILARSPLPDAEMIDDLKRGIKSQAWKFEEYRGPEDIEIEKLKVERIVIGKDFDGPNLQLTINLAYPGDTSLWNLKYFKEGNRGSFNWIPRNTN